MGFRTYTCVICGAECSKRSSLVYGEGRACRTHEEVEQKRNETAEAEKNKVLAVVLRTYKTTNGHKHPNVDKLKEWLQDEFVKSCRDNLSEFPSSGKILTTLKVNGYLSLQYEVSEEFVTAMVELIKAHVEDDDWERPAKQNKTQTPRKSAHNDDAGDEPRHRFKAHRDTKEAPRRNPSFKRK